MKRMKRSDPRRIPGEYPGVSAYFLDYPDTYAWLREAHATPVSEWQALALVRKHLPDVRVTFRGRRGWATVAERRLTLPGRTARARRDGVPNLRLGLVLHEIAHFRGNTIRHAAPFCRAFHALIDAHRQEAPHAQVAE